MRQVDIILKAMLMGDKKWTAKDFQYGDNFVGYEASARMSELNKMYPDLFITGKEGRFRTLSIDWTKEKEIKELIDMLGV
jgi:hypothetical protein